MISSYAQVGGSKDWEVLFNSPGDLIELLFVFVFTTLSSAVISFLVGLWARRALSRVSAENWCFIAKLILRKWVLGANFFGLLILLADVVFQWRGPVLQPGGSVAAVVGNIAYFVGSLFGCSMAGLITGFVSRRGLRQAIADDEFCASRARA
jgi:hypothetical protein